ncbi:GAF domain-containing protein [Desulfotomaculum sp. 1211_IL3151]|uniref:GAF domain-containing protein n=1 Tax=Desulfotomaculum sp. 1211_IL3151 TaxID=3084055 RepID=UPI002FD9A210
MRYQDKTKEQLIAELIKTQDENKKLSHLFNMLLKQLKIIVKERTGEIEKANKKLNEILESISDGFFALDKEWNFTYVNKYQDYPLNKNRAELLGKNIWDILHEVIHSTFYKELHRAMSERIPVNFETKSIYNNIYYEVQAYPYDDGISVFMKDISERKAMENNIKLNQMRLEALLEMNQMKDASINEVGKFVLNQMIKLTGSEIGYFALVNEDETMTEVSFRSENVMSACKIKEQSPIFFSIKDGGIWAEAIRQRKVTIINDYDAELPGKKGLPVGHIPLTRVLNAPIFSGNRIVMNAIVANKKDDYNLTDANQLSLLVNGYWSFIQQKKNEEEKIKTELELKRLDRLNLIGQMAAGISHEVRNPMTTVRGFLQMLQSKEECSRYQDFFKLMIEELDRTNSMLTEFLSITKIKPEELRVESINQIINAMIPLIQADAVGQYKYVETQLNDVPNLLLDSKEIRQLVLNLCRNGLEAMPGGKYLTISTYKEDNYVVVAVKDQGTGIKPELLKIIGTPFFSTKANGTGLGLGICYSIAARHNAEIEIQTGQDGTTFLVKFKILGSKVI